VLQVVGVDGYPRGWIAVVLEDGRFARARRLESLRAVALFAPDAHVVAVDIPIGAPDVPPRPADVEAVLFVGPRRASVFATPPRAALSADSYATANELCRSRGWKGISQQAWSLRHKILEAEELADSDRRFIEVHPEVSFRELAGAPLPSPKTSWNGLMLRLRLLAGAGIEFPDELEHDVPAVDLLDAAIAAWSASRYARGEARPMPESLDERVGPIWR
jgi:predicted RNase H-like nuclease